MHTRDKKKKKKTYIVLLYPFDFLLEQIWRPLDLELELEGL